MQTKHLVRILSALALVQCAACAHATHFVVINATAVPLCSVSLESKGVVGAPEDENGLAEKQLAPGDKGHVSGTFQGVGGPYTVRARDCQGNMVAEVPAGGSVDEAVILK